MGSNNKRFRLAGAALASFLAFAGPASAQNWSGLYVGASAGYGWGKADTSIEPIGAPPTVVSPSTLKPRPSGSLLGLQAGYNWQNGNLVFGAEADISRTGMKDADRTSNFSVNGVPAAPGSRMSSKQDIDALGTLRARLGYAAAGNWLVYGTGGLAWGRVKNNANVEFPGLAYPASESNARSGWTAGAGAEWAMSRATSLKFEYLHYDLGSSSDSGSPVPPGPPFVTKYTWDAKGNLLRAGVNFRF
jgi:outer membrane immunogenic protein